MALIQPKDSFELRRLYQAVREASKRLAETLKAHIDAEDEYRRACKAYDDAQKALSAEHNKADR